MLSAYFGPMTPFLDVVLLIGMVCGGLPWAINEVAKDSYVPGIIFILAAAVLPYIY